MPPQTPPGPLDAYDLQELPIRLNHLIEWGKTHDAAAADKIATANSIYAEAAVEEARLTEALTHISRSEAMRVGSTAYRLYGDRLLERITLVEPGELARRIGAAKVVEKPAAKVVEKPAEDHRLAVGQKVRITWPGHYAFGQVVTIGQVVGTGGFARGSSGFTYLLMPYDCEPVDEKPAEDHSVNPVVVPLGSIEDALAAEYPRIDFGPVIPAVAGHTGRTLRSVSRTLAAVEIGPHGYPAEMSDQADADESEGN